MKKTFIAILITIAASAAQAQSSIQPATPDYSPDHLRQVFSSADEPQVLRNVHFGWGYFDFHAFGVDWRFSPLLAPLHGSVPGTTRVLPDAFSLNHVVFPGGPGLTYDDADTRRELKRIARITRE